MYSKRAVRASRWVRQVGAERLAGEECALQGREEAFGHRVVVAIADGPHRAADADRLAALAEQQRGVLAAMVGVVNDARAGSPGRRVAGSRQTAISSALTTSSVRRCSAMAHPTTRRLNPSRITAR
jgi:hypothetical protein